jgi:hypothetical protein
MTTCFVSPLWQFLAVKESSEQPASEEKQKYGSLSKKSVANRAVTGSFLVVPILEINEMNPIPPPTFTHAPHIEKGHKHFDSGDHFRMKAQQK